MLYRKEWMQIESVFITDEQISNMRKELEKYGIQMPAFSKIGGILANEVWIYLHTFHIICLVYKPCLYKGKSSSL